MRKFLLIPLLLILCACSEEIDVRSRSDYHDYLAVQAVLTNLPDQPQQVVLSHSISYFHDEAQPMVKGASVMVNDVVFKEMTDGVYVAPMGYCCQQGEEYHLHIRLADGAEYEADAATPEPGFEIEEIDYAWGGGKTMDNDSLWTIGVWGLEKDIDSYYLITHAVNGLPKPYGMATVTEDTYFNDHDIAAFPIEPLLQTAENRKLYGDCFKYLETGDILTLEIWSLERPFEKFLSSMKSGGTSIPLFSSQPANQSTNIRGGQVMGYFGVCWVVRASVVVDDPFRPYFKRMMPPTPPM